MPIVHKYPLPYFLEGIVTVSQYDKWLNCKADTLRKRDITRGKAYTTTCTKAVYKDKIHTAILSNGLKDPYTAEVMRWDLIGAWDNKNDLRYFIDTKVFNKEFYLLPTVDHADPNSEILEFEICSWIVNSSKTVMTPLEFRSFCRKVAQNSP